MAFLPATWKAEVLAGSPTSPIPNTISGIWRPADGELCHGSKERTQLAGSLCSPSAGSSPGPTRVAGLQSPPTSLLLLGESNSGPQIREALQPLDTGYPSVTATSPSRSRFKILESTWSSGETRASQDICQTITQHTRTKRMAPCRLTRLRN